MDLFDFKNKNESENIKYYRYLIKYQGLVFASNYLSAIGENCGKKVFLVAPKKC
jgi:hypothetical protein